MKFIPLLFLILLALFGVSVELNPNAQAWQLLIGFHAAGLAAMTWVSLWGLRQRPKAKGFWFIGLQLLAFRIAYFPIVVFSATVSCYIELLVDILGFNVPIKIFPELFVSAAVFFALINYALFLALTGRFSVLALIVILGWPAVLISFANQQDLTILPDNNWADLQLPTVSLPQANPYGAALKADNSLGQKMIGLSGYVLYDYIPNSPWAQAVQGTLEQAYLKHPEGNAHDQLTYHYAAFLAAHRAKSL